MKTRSLQNRVIQKQSVDANENLSPTEYLYVQNCKEDMSILLHTVISLLGDTNTCIQNY